MHTSCLRKVVVPDVSLSPTRGLGSRISCAGLCSRHHGGLPPSTVPYRMTGGISLTAAWKTSCRSTRRALQLRASTTSAAPRGNRTALQRLSLPRAATGACALAVCRTMAHPISSRHKQAPRSTTCVVASSLPALNVPVRAPDRTSVLACSTINQPWPPPQVCHCKTLCRCLRVFFRRHRPFPGYWQASVSSRA
jgi:hypothetical protein